MDSSLISVLILASLVIVLLHHHYELRPRDPIRQSKNNAPGQGKKLVLRKLARKDVSIVNILLEVDPIDLSFGCMYHEFVHTVPCKNSIISSARKGADTQRRILAVRPQSASAYRNMLEFYRGYLLCTPHRKIIEGPDSAVWRGQLEDWVEELQDLIAKDVAQAALNLAAIGMRSSPSAPSRLARQSTPQVVGGFKGMVSSGPYDAVHLVDEQPTAIKDHVVQLYRERFLWVCPPNSAESTFSPYLPPSGSIASLLGLIRDPLTVTEQESGVIYIFRRKEANAHELEHVKIGKSRDAVRRMKAIETECRYTPESVFISARVKNVKRIEKLIHMELMLASKQRYDHRCTSNVDYCGTVHHEWFETDPVHARKVVEHWTLWMERFDPYDSMGRPKPELLAQTFNSTATQPAKTRESTQLDSISFHRDSSGQFWHLQGLPLDRRPLTSASGLLRSPQQQPQTYKQTRVEMAVDRQQDDEAVNEADPSEEAQGDMHNIGNGTMLNDGHKHERKRGDASDIEMDIGEEHDDHDVDHDSNSDRRHDEPGVQYKIPHEYTSPAPAVKTVKTVKTPSALIRPPSRQRPAPTPYTPQVLSKPSYTPSEQKPVSFNRARNSSTKGDSNGSEIGGANRNRSSRSVSETTHSAFRTGAGTSTSIGGGSGRRRSGLIHSHAHSTGELDVRKGDIGSASGNGTYGRRSVTYGDGVGSSKEKPVDLTGLID